MGIIKELRWWRERKETDGVKMLLGDAATEIERLRVEIGEIKAVLESTDCEVERLRENCNWLSMVKNEEQLRAERAEAALKQIVEMPGADREDQVERAWKIGRLAKSALVGE